MLLILNYVQFDWDVENGQKSELCKMCSKRGREREYLSSRKMFLVEIYFTLKKIMNFLVC